MLSHISFPNEYGNEPGSLGQRYLGEKAGTFLERRKASKLIGCYWRLVHQYPACHWRTSRQWHPARMLKDTFDEDFDQIVLVRGDSDLAPTKSEDFVDYVLKLRGIGHLL